MELFTTVKWRIENVSILVSRSAPEDILHSDPFTLPNNIKMGLMFYPINAEKDYSSLYLVSLNLEKTNFATLKFKFWMENDDGEILLNSAGKLFC